MNIGTGVKRKVRALNMRKKLWQNLISVQTLSNIAVVFFGVGLYVCLQNLKGVSDWISGILNMCTPFVLAFAIAFLLNPLVKWFEKKLSIIVKKNIKLRMAAAILCTYIVATAFLSIIIAMVVPQAVQSLVTLFNRLPEYLVNLNTILKSLEEQLRLESGQLTGLLGQNSKIVNSITSSLSRTVPQMLNYSIRFGSGVLDIIMAIIVSVYMLAGKRRLLRQCRKLLFSILPTPRADTFFDVAVHANTVFSSFFIGKTIDSLLIGVICFIGMIFIQLPYAPLISLTIGVTNFIPFFGPIIGAIPCMLILLIVNPIDALWFAIFILLLQQFDGNFLGPHILGDSTGLSPIWVLVAIVIGGGMFGVSGMILGVPVFAVLYHFTSSAIDKALHRKGLNEDGYKIQDLTADTVLTDNSKP